MINIDNNKAIEIAKEKIRVWREVQFTENDVKIQNALVDGSVASELINRREYLRNLPQECENKTVVELEEILLKEGI